MHAHPHARTNHFIEHGEKFSVVYKAAAVLVHAIEQFSSLRSPKLGLQTRAGGHVVNMYM